MSASDRLVVDDLALEVRRSARRKTLGLTVERGGALVVSAPVDVPREALAAFVREKRFWVYSKLAEQAAHARPAPRGFVAGAGFFHLGRRYRLRLVDEQAAPLKLAGGWFLLRRDEQVRARAHFVRWYTARAEPWLRRRMAPWAARMEARPAGLRVLDLGYRWGSCRRGGGVNFHWATITLPPPVVDYVIVHELAHLAEPGHSPAFWARVGRALPEYAERKAWLAAEGGGYVLP